MLKIENHKKLLGTKLYGNSKSDSTHWLVTSIMEHLHHYIIFIEQPDEGWERKVVLHKQHTQKRIGYQYKLECGEEFMYLERDSIKNVDFFCNHLESFL